MENNKNDIQDIVYGVAIFIMMGIMVLGAVLYCMNDYKEEKEKPLIITKVEACKTCLDTQEYYITCSDSTLTYRSTIPYKIGDTLKIK